jgi:hypothetical protein
MDGAQLVNKAVRADEAQTVLFATGRLEELKNKVSRKGAKFTQRRKEEN